MSTQCPHGQLARQCLLCEQAAEIERLTRRNNELRTANGFAELEAEIERLRQMLRNLMDIAEYWFLKGAERDMSESEYRNWRSMSYESKAYQNAKQALRGEEE